MSWMLFFKKEKRKLEPNVNIPEMSFLDLHFMSAGCCILGGDIFHSTITTIKTLETNLIPT